MDKRDRLCSYIFKRGIKKGTVCNVRNCKAHMEKHPQKSEKIKVSNEPYKQQILDLDTSMENKSVVLKHYQNLKKLDSSTSEYYKNLLFVDCALTIPWNNYYNIRNRIKDEDKIKVFIEELKTQFDDHIYGMENVKNEIINYVCKFISNPISQKNNIALYGSAGVCKTKFIKILSKVLQAPIKVISLGGTKDSSYFLGHNFTYVESHCGIIIQSLIDTKVMNPIMYFDELDKVSMSDIGNDVYSVLSNLTDPTINSHFTDHYFRGINFDLSKVFYVFTFNDISKIDKVLLDRLNVVYVETPSKGDRLIILSKYCLPELLDNIGIKQELNFDNECFELVVRQADTIVDFKVSSGIRESVRILEKILLEINKEILCEIIPNNESLHINYNQFETYFNRLKPQLLIGNEQSKIPIHMYI